MRMILIMKRTPTKKSFSSERKTVPNQPASLLERKAMREEAKK